MLVKLLKMPDATQVMLVFLLARTLQDVFLLPLIQWIDQGGSIVYFLLYDLL